MYEYVSMQGKGNGLTLLLLLKHIQKDSNSSQSALAFPHILQQIPIFLVIIELNRNGSRRNNSDVNSRLHRQQPFQLLRGGMAENLGFWDSIAQLHMNMFGRKDSQISQSNIVMLCNTISIHANAVNSPIATTSASQARYGKSSHMRYLDAI